MKTIYVSLTLSLLFVCSTVGAEKSIKSKPITSLANKPVNLPDRVVHGMALFESLQGRQFSAISLLLRGASVVSNNSSRVKSRQLLAELYSNYGLRHQATQLFNSLTKESTITTLESQERAWFGIAKQRYQRGYILEAGLALNHIHSEIPKSKNSEFLEMKSNVYLVKKQFKKAKDTLSPNTGQFWQKYAQLNLAKSLVSEKRIVEAIVLLQDITELDTISSEYQALRDEANLTLGYIFLKQNKAQQTLRALNHVSLSGISANKALLGLGLAWKLQQESEKVMATWSELANRNFTDPAVQQAWYLMPVYLEKIKKPKLAAIQYQQSNNRIDNQLATIEEIIGIVAQGEFLRTLKPEITSREHSLAWLSAKLPVSISSLYLSRLIASTKFQDALSQYQDILYLQFITSNNNRTLIRLDNNLKLQTSSFQNKFKLISSKIKTDKVKYYKSKFDSFVLELKQIENSNSIYAMANTVENNSIHKLDNIGRRLILLPQNENSKKLLERLQVLNGIMHWQLAANFKPRLIKAKVSIQALSSALINNTKALKHLYALDTVPSLIPALIKKVNDKSKRITKLKTSLQKVLEQQGHYIESLALFELKQQRTRLQSYQRRIRFAQARLFDQLAQATESP